MIKAGEFNNIFSSSKRFPKIDAIRNSLMSVSLKVLRMINEKIIKKSVRSKVLDDGTINGYTVVAIDCTNLFNPQKPHCGDCVLKMSEVATSSSA